MTRYFVLLCGRDESRPYNGVLLPHPHSFDSLFAHQRLLPPLLSQERGYRGDFGYNKNHAD